MLQLQAGSRTLLHKVLGMVEELAERCGDSSGDWDTDLIAMNMEIWIHLHDEPIYRCAAQPFYKGLLALQGMKVSRCFLQAGQNLLLMSEIHFSVCCFSGWGWAWGEDGWCLLACLLFFFPIWWKPFWGICFGFINVCTDFTVHHGTDSFLWIISLPQRIPVCFNTNVSQQYLKAFPTKYLALRLFHLEWARY